MHLDILIDMKLLLCGVTSPRIALAILAKQSAGFAFLLYGKLLVVWCYATKNCFSNSCKAKRWLCFFTAVCGAIHQAACRCLPAS